MHSHRALTAGLSAGAGIAVSAAAFAATVPFDDIHELVSGSVVPFAVGTIAGVGIFAAGLAIADRSTARDDERASSRAEALGDQSRHAHRSKARHGGVPEGVPVIKRAQDAMSEADAWADIDSLLDSDSPVSCDPVNSRDIYEIAFEELARASYDAKQGAAGDAAGAAAAAPASAVAPAGQQTVEGGTFTVPVPPAAVTAAFTRMAQTGQVPVIHQVGQAAPAPQKETVHTAAAVPDPSRPAADEVPLSSAQAQASQAAVPQGFSGDTSVIWNAAAAAVAAAPAAMAAASAANQPDATSAPSGAYAAPATPAAPAPDVSATFSVTVSPVSTQTADGVVTPATTASFIAMATGVAPAAAAQVQAPAAPADAAPAAAPVAQPQQSAAVPMSAAPASAADAVSAPAPAPVEVPMADYSGHESMWAEALAILAEPTPPAYEQSSAPIGAHSARRLEDTDPVSRQRMGAVAEGANATGIHARVNEMLEEELEKVPSQSMRNTSREYLRVIQGGTMAMPRLSAEA